MWFILWAETDLNGKKNFNSLKKHSYKYHSNHFIILQMYPIVIPYI